MTVKSTAALFSISLFLTVNFVFAKSYGGVEYTGQFEKTLVPNTEEFERVISKPTASEQWKSFISDADSKVTTAKLFNPSTGESSILSILIDGEDEDFNPVIFIDVNADNSLTPDEKFSLKRLKSDNPYLWEATISLGVKDGFFTACSIYLRYFKSVTLDKMSPGERLLTQSTEVFARGGVDVKGRKVLVQYEYKADSKKVNPQTGWLGMDIDGNGDIDMDNLSFEAAKADNESVVFKIGDTYLSTKKADISKNQIVIREHEAKEYKRLELSIGKEFPDFTFTDYEGNKKKFSDFRGKFVLLDVWGFWCPPCRKELPYIREAYKRFQGRNLEIVGLNTDEGDAVDVKQTMRTNDMKWTVAKFESVVDFLRSGLRINSFPTTLLISPQGKIISMSREERDELDLRGQDLLKSLDKTLPR